MNYQYHLELHLLYSFIGAVIIAISLYGFGIYSKINPIFIGFLIYFIYKFFLDIFLRGLL